MHFSLSYHNEDLPHMSEQKVETLVQKKRCLLRVTQLIWGGGSPAPG